MIALIIGVLVAIIIILRFKQTRFESSKFAYSLLLITFPFYYLIFAIYGNDYAAVSLEFFGGLPFFIIAFVALKVNAVYRFNLLAIAYILHGVYDLTHNLFFMNTGTPDWWPEFCAVVDLLLGLYLLNLASRYRVRNV
jgi:hypothetical protein